MLKIKRIRKNERQIRKNKRVGTMEKQLTRKIGMKKTRWDTCDNSYLDKPRFDAFNVFRGISVWR